MQVTPFQQRFQLGFTMSPTSFGNAGRSPHVCTKLLRAVSDTSGTAPNPPLPFFGNSVLAKLSPDNARSKQRPVVL